MIENRRWSFVVGRWLCGRCRALARVGNCSLSGLDRWWRMRQRVPRFVRNDKQYSE